MFESCIKMKPAAKKKLPNLKISSQYPTINKQFVNPVSKLRYSINPLHNNKRKVNLLTSIASPSRHKPVEDDKIIQKFSSPKQGVLRKAFLKPFKSPKTLLPFPPKLHPIYVEKNESTEENEVSFGCFDERFDWSGNIFSHN